MGPGLVLWAIAGAAVSLVGAIVLAGLAFVLTRHVEKRTALLIRLAAIALPFLSVGWLFAVLIAQGVVNTMYFHRDMGFGDSWYTPLPNGYSILMIDVTDSGMVCKTVPGEDAPCNGGEQSDVLSSVTKLQLAGQYMLGESNPPSLDSSAQSHGPDTYFLTNSATGATREFATSGGLLAVAVSLHIAPKLEPIETVYDRYRATWFDFLAAAVALIPPGLGFLLLLLWIVRARRRVADK